MRAFRCAHMLTGSPVGAVAGVRQLRAGLAWLDLADGVASEQRSASAPASRAACSERPALGVRARSGPSVRFSDSTDEKGWWPAEKAAAADTDTCVVASATWPPEMDAGAPAAYTAVDTQEEWRLGTRRHGRKVTSRWPALDAGARCVCRTCDLRVVVEVIRVRFV